MNLILYNKYDGDQLVFCDEPTHQKTFQEILLQPAEWTQEQVKEQIRQEHYLSDGERGGSHFPKFKYVLMPHDRSFLLVTAQEFLLGIVPEDETNSRNELQNDLTHPNTKIDWVKTGGVLIVAGIGSFLIVNSLKNHPGVLKEDKKEAKKEA